MFTRTLIAVAVISTLTGPLAHASEGVTSEQAKQAEYVYRTAINQNANIPQWIIMNYLYAPWQNINGLHTCTPWQPDVSTIDLGTSFQQNRLCQQSQERIETPVLYNPVLRTSKHGEPRTGERNVSVTQYQAATGARDFITGEQALAWSSWGDTGGHYACAPWAPTPDTVNLDAAFVQQRACSQDQSASRQVVHTWASGLTTPKRLEERTQTISETESRPNIGTKDFINGERIGMWSAWTANGNNYACSLWSPSTAAVNLGVNFEQARDCQQDQQRERNVYDTWKSGREDLARVETGNQTLTVGETQAATGSKDYITGELDYGAWSTWAAVSDHSHTEWSPATNTVNLGEAYTQSRDYQQVQTRSRQVYDVWASGKTTDKEVATENRTAPQSEQRGATGAKDYITGTAYGAWSGWSNDGAAHSYSSYSPDASTVNWGASFTQSRTYVQPVKRTRTVYDVWKSGTQTAKATEPDYTNETRTQTRSETGTKDYVTGTAYGAWSGWSNTGGPYDYSGWDKSCGSYNIGTTFTRARTYKQDKTRTRTKSYTWASGKTPTVYGTDPGSDTVTLTQTDSEAGCADYITGTAYGAWTGWSNDGGAHSYSSYSPAASTVNWGVSFTQSRTYVQPLKRTRAIYSVWASGRQTSAGTDTGYDSDTRTQTRSDTGTKDYIASQGTDYGNWSTYSTSCTTWSPTTASQPGGLSFTQTRSCTPKQRRTVRTQYNWASGSTTYGSSSYGYADGTAYSQSQPAVGTGTVAAVSSSSVTSPVYNYGTASCGGWTPSAGSYYTFQSVAQTRSCTQPRRYDKTTTTTMSDGSTQQAVTSHTASAYSYTESRTVPGVKADYVTSTITERGDWSSWANTSCSGWYPNTNNFSNGTLFTQYRDCEQSRTRPYIRYDLYYSGKKVRVGAGTNTQNQTVQDTREVWGTGACGGGFAICEF